jgi:hypothetical protein
MSVILRRIVFLGTLVFALGCFWAAPASAQATRTWVSGVGDDANPCSRTAPCKTFAGAISKTAAGGEINCLDPGGFGALTIVKSISIVCDFTEAGVLAAGAGVNGMVVNAAATDRIYLSGLDFNGVGTAQNGLRVVSGGVVHLNNSVIRNFRATNGRGISYQPAGAGVLFITNSTIADNGTGATGGGILIQPTGAGGGATVVMSNVRVQNNANAGITADTTGNTGGGIVINIDNGSIAGSATGILGVRPVGAPAATVNINNSEVLANTSFGLRANGSLMRVGNTSIMGNGTGVSAVNGGVIESFGTNRNEGNGTNGSFDASLLSET